ncbi:hypothetical protein HBB16_09555 [Pseudonocardia sp. MCCB 268]|nr:hypothetical protein [Pseudonocardia cytotoxica]
MRSSAGSRGHPGHRQHAQDLRRRSLRGAGPLRLRSAGTYLPGVKLEAAAKPRSPRIYHARKDDRFFDPDGEPHPRRGALQLSVRPQLLGMARSWHLGCVCRAAATSSSPVACPRPGRFIHEAPNDRRRRSCSGLRAEKWRSSEAPDGRRHEHY